MPAAKIICQKTKGYVKIETGSQQGLAKYFLILFTIDKSEFEETVIMRIDFNKIDLMTFPGMNNGTGTMSTRMYNDDSYRIIPTTIYPGGSIGMHIQDSGDDLNYIISGAGKAICDGIEEELRPGVMHICPKGSEHSIINIGEEDLVMLTIVVKK
jgi:quercetin dioxygenase-like cupin family protein